MQKKVVTLLFIAIMTINNVPAQEGTVIPLAEPERTGGMPLFEALDKRQTIRTYKPVELSPQDLSNLLWAAFGINREDGRRTAPSARNWKHFDIYLITAGGWYLYEPQDHALIKLGNEDLREHAGGQDFVQTAPLNLIFVSDQDRITGINPERKDFYSLVDAGFISQNVYLFCTSEGLATVVRAAIDKENLHKVLKLKPSQQVVLAQTVGYPGE